MKKTLNAVTDVYNKAKNFIISGSGQFTTKVRNILKKYGNEIIHSIVVIIINQFTWIKGKCNDGSGDYL